MFTRAQNWLNDVYQSVLTRMRQKEWGMANPSGFAIGRGEPSKVESLEQRILLSYETSDFNPVVSPGIYNQAFGKEVTVSSENNWNGEPEKITNGGAGPWYPNNTSNAWFYVDLEQETSITKVRILTHDNAIEDEEWKLYISDTEPTGDEVPANLIASRVFSADDYLDCTWVEFDVPAGTIGQYVKLHITGSGSFASVREMQVMGSSHMPDQQTHSDSDLDGLVEVGADITSWGVFTGAIVHDPYFDSPMVYLPIRASDYSALPVHVYFSQGAAGDKISYSHDTKILWAYQNDHEREKYVLLQRPTGAVVKFEFAYENGAFNDYGTPVGENANRTYVLREIETEEEDRYPTYELHFESGIVHHYWSWIPNQVNYHYNQGELWKITHADGRDRVYSDPASDLEIDTNSYGFHQDISIAFTGDDLDTITYDIDGTSEVTVDVLTDGNGIIKSLDKTVTYGNPDMNAGTFEYGTVFDFHTVSNGEIRRGEYTGGGIGTEDAIIYRRSGGSLVGDGASTITFETTIDERTVETVNSYNSVDQLTSSVFTANDGSVTTTYDYLTESASERFAANQGAKWAKVTRVQNHTTGAWAQYAYDATTGWLTDVYTPFEGSAVGQNNAPSANNSHRVHYSYAAALSDQDRNKLFAALPDGEWVNVNGQRMTELTYAYSDIDSGGYTDEAAITDVTRNRLGSHVNLVSQRTRFRGGQGFTLDDNYGIWEQFTTHDGSRIDNYLSDPYGNEYDETISLSDGRLIEARRKFKDVTTESRSPVGYQEYGYGFGRVSVIGHSLLPDETVTEYNAFGATQITHSDGSVTEYEDFTADGLAQRVTHYRDGNVEGINTTVTELVYDDLGLVSQRVVTDNRNEVTHVTTINYTYDALGRLTKEEILNGATTDYAYVLTNANNKHFIETSITTDERGKRVVKTYIDGRTKSEIVFDENEAEIERRTYDYGVTAYNGLLTGTTGLSTEVTESIYKEGATEDRVVTSYQNDLGQVYKIKSKGVKAGNTRPDLVTTYEYNNQFYDQLDKITSYDGVVTEFFYANSSNPSGAYATGGTHEMVKRVVGDVVTEYVNDVLYVPNDNTQKYLYSRVIQKGGQGDTDIVTESRSYLTLRDGLIKNETIFMPGVSGFERKSEATTEYHGMLEGGVTAGQTKQVITRPDGTTVETVMDAGNQTTTKDSQRHAGGNGTTVTFGGGGFTKSIQGAFTHQTFSDYNPYGQVGTINDVHRGQETVRTINTAGDVTSVQRPDHVAGNERIVNIEHDSRGLINGASGAGTYYQDYELDQDGQVDKLKTSGQRETKWIYDDVTGLPLKKVLLEGATEVTLAEYKYDSKLYLKEIIRGTGSDKTTEVRTYEDGTAQGEVVTGRLKSRTIKNATNQVTATYTYEYDDFGRHWKITGPDGTQVYAYTADGLLASETYTNSLNVVTVNSYTYDHSKGRLLTEKTTVAGVQVHFKNYAGKYDTGASERLKGFVTDAGRAFDWVYEAGSSLVDYFKTTISGSELKVDSTPDAAGRSDSRTVTFGGTTIGGYDVTFKDKTDLKEQVLLTFTDPVTGQVTEWFWEYGYNENDELVSAVLKDNVTGAAIPGFSFYYDYDGIGNRNWKSTAEGTTYYQSDYRNELIAVEVPTVASTMTMNAQGGVQLFGLMAQQSASAPPVTSEGDDDIELGDEGGTYDAHAGNDIVVGGAGVDIIYGGLGEDLILGEGGDDTIYGETDDDVIIGGAGIDVMYGGAGDDKIYANYRTYFDDAAAFNFLAGDVGDDELYGSSTNDRYYYIENNGHDKIFEFGGSDDQLRFYTGIFQSDITMKRNGNDLVLEVKSPDNTVTLVDWYVAPENHIDHIYFNNVLSGGWDKQEIVSRANGIIPMGEVDTIQVDSSVQTVTLERRYQNAVVIANLASEVNSHEVSVRVSNVTGTSFDIQLTEPTNRDGVHVAETVTYMVFEAGVYALEDGRILEVGSFSTDATRGNRTPNSQEAWYTHTFSAAFTDDPIVISQVQTVNNEFTGPDADDMNRYMKLRMRNVDTGDFDVALEGQENKTYVFTEEETIGFMAISSGAGIWSGLKTEALSQNINYKATAIDFTQNFNTDPGVIASLMTYAAADTVNVRMTSVNRDSVSLHAEEDKTKDNGIGHPNERAGVFAIEGSGILTAVDEAMIPAGELEGFGELELLQTLVDGDPGLNKLASPGEMVISSDGKHAYAISGEDDAIVIFDRDPNTGELSHNKTIYDGAYDGFGNKLHYLESPTAIAISPDGSRVYVTSEAFKVLNSFTRHSDTGLLELEVVSASGTAWLHSVGDIAVSQDGEEIYITSRTFGSIAIYRHDQNGGLSSVNSYRDDHNPHHELAGAYGVALSPDGNHVYVTAYDDDAITVFRTGSSGGEAILLYVEDFKNGDTIDLADGSGQVALAALNGAKDIEVAPDGKHVFVASEADATVAVFARDSATGKLSLVEVLKQGTNDSYGEHIPRLGANSIKVSADGEHVYVSSGLSNNESLVVFKRDNLVSSGNFGRLNYMGDYRQGFADGKVVNGILSAQSVMSPDGKYVYAMGVSDDGIGVFERDGTTGNLTFIHSLMEGEHDKYGNLVTGLDGAYYAAVSKDNRFVFVSALNGDGLSVFRRDFQTGELVFVEAVFNGGQDSQGNNITDMDGPLVLALSADGKQLYVPTQYSDSLLVFDIDEVSGKLILNHAPLLRWGGDGGLHWPIQAYASPDGKHVYTSSHESDELGIYNVNPDGSLSYQTVLQDGALDGNGNVIDGLYRPSSSILSADGEYLYVTSLLGNSISVFKRDQVTGNLTWEQTIEEGDDLGGGVTMDGLLKAIQVAFSGNQDYLYVAANDSYAINIFSRDHATGHLTWVETVKDGGVDSYGNTVYGLNKVRSVFASPDGKHLYTASHNHHVLAFEIDDATGQLRFIDSERQGYRSTGNQIESLSGSYFVTESPDGKNIYTTAINSDAISVFGRVDEYATSGDYYVRYGATDDEFLGQAGDDVVIGGDGLNYGNLSSGNDLYIGGNDRDDVRGGSGDDVLVGGLSGDILYGGDGTDYIYASFRTDFSNTNNGDWMAGYGGDDHLYGDSGDDVYYYHVGDGHDYIYEVDVSTSDGDRLRFMSGITEDDITMKRRGLDLVLELDADSSVTLVEWYASGSDYRSIDNIYFDNQTTGGWDHDGIEDQSPVAPTYGGDNGPGGTDGSGSPPDDPGDGGGGDPGDGGGGGPGDGGGGLPGTGLVQDINNDSRGNRLNFGDWLYSWDEEDRLIGVMTDPLIVTDPALQIEVQFDYDSLGRRTEKRVYTSTSTEIRRFVYDGMLLIAELNSANTVLRSYSWMPGSDAIGGIGQLIEIVDHENGQTYVPTYDANGNVTQLVNASDGSVDAVYIYSPYGVAIYESGTQQALDANPFMFSTKYFDREVGLYYYGYRYYDPETGTWLNRDPIQEDGGLNTTAFVNNDPVNKVDAYGNEPVSKEALDRRRLDNATYYLGMSPSGSGLDPNTRRFLVAIGNLHARNKTDMHLFPGTESIANDPYFQLYRPLFDIEPKRYVQKDNVAIVLQFVSTVGNSAQILTGGLLVASGGGAPLGVIILADAGDNIVGDFTGNQTLKGRAISGGLEHAGVSPEVARPLGDAGGAGVSILLNLKADRVFKAVTAVNQIAKVDDGLNVMDNAADMTKADFIQEALSKGVGTNRDELILWAGLGDTGPDISNAYAKVLGGRTLQQTPGGSWLASQNLFGANSPVSIAEAVEIWAEVSKQAVRQASGQVRSVVGNVSPATIYRRIELPELRANPRVTGVDEMRVTPLIK